MIEYRIGTRNSGKSYKLDKKLSGQRNLYLHGRNHNRRRYLKLKNENFPNIDYSKSDSYSIFDLPIILSSFDNIIIDDLNLFLKSLFPKNNIYVNISPHEHGVVLKEITRGKENKLI